MRVSPPLATKANQTQIAKILGVSARSIQNYMDPEITDPPMPYVRKGQESLTFDITACVQWFIAYEIEKYKRSGSYSPSKMLEEQFKEQQAKTRLAIAKADTQEGLLVRADDVKAVWTAHIQQAKAVLLRYPHKLAMAIVDGMNYQERKAAAMEVVVEIANTLADSSTIEGEVIPNGDE